MDRRVPPRVTFWTGIWDPAREALSREVDILRRLDGARAPVVSFSPGQRSALTPDDGVFRLSGRRWLLLRALGACIEPMGDVTHVLGPMNSWHLLRALGTRPLLFTVASLGPPLEAALYEKVRLFVAETEQVCDALKRAGIPEPRIRIVYPGIDLERFAPATPAAGRFRVLFASSPADVPDFEARGIPLMVEAARLSPHIDFVLLWRQWGSRSETERALAALRPPKNLLVDHRDAENMASVYQHAHATIWMAAPGYGKSCPNSVVEGLACGRPAIVSPSCGIADLLRRERAAVTPQRDPQAIANAIVSLLTAPEAWRQRARDTAERHFSLTAFSQAYRSLYSETADRARAGE